MSNILRNMVRGNTFKILAMPQMIGVQCSAGASRSFWHLTKQTATVQRCPGCNGSCTGCSGRRFASTNGEKALIEFLQEEIASEKENLAGHLPSELDGFQIDYSGSDVELKKKSGNETVEIAFNINHTVDTEDAEDELSYDNQQNAQQESPKLHAKPNFEVNINKNGTTLSLTCAYLQGKPAEGEFDDVFGIEELTIFKGEHDDKVYACAGDILDGYFYDLLMNLLSEKGITDEFVNKISELATQYEQKLYVNLLQDTKQFFEK